MNKKNMSLLIYILFGAIAGWIASMIMGTNGQQGWIMNIVLGIAGAFVGGLIMNMLGFSGVTDFNLYSLLVAIGGAVILVWLGSMFLGRRTV